VTNNSIIRDVGLVGAGYWGKNLARNFNELGRLGAICDRSPEVLGSYGEAYSQVKQFSSFDLMLEDPALSKVAIAAPAALHFQLARRALLAAKDVFVEKPLCLDVGEAEELASLAESTGRILMVGHLLQYHPCVRRLLELVELGELGRLQYITSNRLNLGKIRQEENALWSFAPHDISVILALVGNSLPRQVRCIGESYLTPQVADTTLTTLQFNDHARAHVYVSWLNPFKEQKLTVVGSKGMVVFDDTKPWTEKLTIYRDYLTWSQGRMPTPSKAAAEAVSVAHNEPLHQECSHFLDSCSTRQQPRTNAREGIRVLMVLKAAQASLEKDGEAVSCSSTPQASFSAHPTAIVDPKAKIGAGTKIWHFSHIMVGAEVGTGCNFGQNVVVSPGVKLGNNVKVQNNVSIYTGAIIEDDVFLGPSCVLTNVSNPRSQVKRQSLYETTRIRKGATIGANATIVCGTTLGRYCFIAAGAVVTKDVPDYAFMIGVPAKQRGWMSRHGHVLKMGENGDYVCPESRFVYREEMPGTLKCITLDEDAPLPSGLASGTKGFREFKIV